MTAACRECGHHFAYREDDGSAAWDRERLCSSACKAWDGWVESEPYEPPPLWDLFSNGG